MDFPGRPVFIQFIPEVGDDVAVAERHLGRRLRVGVGRPGEEGAGGRGGHPPVVHAAGGTCMGGRKGDYRDGQKSYTASWLPLSVGASSPILGPTFFNITLIHWDGKKKGGH